MFYLKNPKNIPFSNYCRSAKRKDGLCLINDLVEKGVFRRLAVTDKEIIERYAEENSFADLTFSMLWAWNETYNYCIKESENSVFLTGIGIEDNVDCFLMRNDNAEIDEYVSFIADEFFRRGYDLNFENISEKDVELLKSAIASAGNEPAVTYDRDFSDYIYQTDNFLNMSGNSNKGKRSKYNNFTRNHPDVEYVRYKEELYDDAVRIFQQWCSYHKCENCIYGCEYNAFLRLTELYGSSEKMLIGMTYENGEPLSFAAAEFINNTEVSFYMQKNAQRITGLTYYLEVKMLEDMPDAKFVNMGEDMGVEGLRNDKESYHPDFMKHKYRISVKRN